MPAAYQKLGVEFLYPENWEITDEQSTGWPRSVAFQTPEGGFFVLQVHPRTRPLDLAGEVLQTMRSEYASLEAESATEVVEDNELVGFDLHFYYLDLLIAGRVRALERAESTYVWFFQAEDRDYDRLSLVIRALETSLLRGLNKA